MFDIDSIIVAGVQVETKVMLPFHRLRLPVFRFFLPAARPEVLGVLERPLPRDRPGLPALCPGALDLPDLRWREAKVEASEGGIHQYWLDPTNKINLAGASEVPWQAGVDRMLTARAAADQQKLQDTGHPEKLTRQELAQKKAEFQKAAREGVAARLAAESKKHDGLLGQWLQMDRMYLNVRLKQNLDEVAGDSFDDGSATVDRRKLREILGGKSGQELVFK